MMRRKKKQNYECIGTSPSFKSKKFRESLVNENSTYLEDHVNKVVDKLDTTKKMQKTFENDEDIKISGR